MKTENLAIVFVDMAGFTSRTSAQTREENLQMLHRFDGIVRPLVRVYGGRVIKTIGDAYLLTFRSPTDALLCSMGIHDRLAESNAEVDREEQFAVRAAVNVGDVRIEGGDVFGEAVNIAARIEGKAAGGEIYFSEAVFLSMTRSEVPSEEVGLMKLKGVSGEVRIYRVPRAGEAGGYDLRQRSVSDGAAAGGGTHPLAPVSLPYGGLGLDRVRDRLEAGRAAAVIEPAAAHARRLLEQVRTWLRRGLALVEEAFARWRTEFRRSRTVRIVTVVVVIALVAVLLWFLVLRPKPLTPWEKFQRSLGLR